MAQHRTTHIKYRRQKKTTCNNNERILTLNIVHRIIIDDMGKTASYFMCVWVCFSSFRQLCVPDVVCAYKFVITMSKDRVRYFLTSKIAAISVKMCGGCCCLPSKCSIQFYHYFRQCVRLHKQNTTASYIYVGRMNARARAPVRVRALGPNKIKRFNTYTNNKYYAYACVTKFTASTSAKTLFTLILHIRNSWFKFAHNLHIQTK